ncbi:hypothetical protein AALA17_03880 [Lactobacillaceae bacterium 24-114]
MPWITPHTLFSLTWNEWGSIIAIIGAIVVILRWCIKQLDVELFQPIRKKLGDVNDNLTRFNERQERAEARLENGDKKFILHDQELNDHERRITNLEEHDYERNH